MPEEAAKPKKKAKATTATPVEDPGTKKTAKKEQPERQGLSSKEAAAELSRRLGKEIKPVALRRILRTDDFQNDKGYTRYDLLPEVIDALEVVLKAGATGRTKKAKSEDSEAEAPEELAALDAEDEEDDEVEDLGVDVTEDDESDDDESDEGEDLDEDDDE